MLSRETVRFRSLKALRHKLDQELGKLCLGRVLPTSCFCNKGLLEPGPSRLSPTLWLLQRHCMGVADTQRRPHGPQSLKCLLSGPPQKVPADVCGEGIGNSSVVELPGQDNQHRLLCV